MLPGAGCARRACRQERPSREACKRHPTVIWTAGAARRTTMQPRKLSQAYLSPRAPPPASCFPSASCLYTFTFEAFLVSCHVAGPPPQKQDREQESDGLHRRGLDQKTGRGSQRICWRSRRWLRRRVPGGRRQRRRTPTHFGCLYRQTTTSALQRCAPAAREELLLPPRASVLPRVRARCERRRSRLLTHPLQKAEYEPRRDDSFRAVEEVLTNATAAKVCTCFGRCARERKFARRCLAARMRGCRGAHQAYAVPCTPNE